MEIFGIVLSVPAAFVASAVYSFVVRWLTSRLPWLAKPALGASVVVLVALLIEWCLLGVVGAVRSREIIGPLFYTLHLAVFFLCVPALANILVLRSPGGGVWKLPLIALCCAALALPVVLTQVAVSEALYGVDGSGGPYATN